MYSLCICNLRFYLHLFAVRKCHKLCTVCFNYKYSATGSKRFSKRMGKTGNLAIILSSDEDEDVENVKKCSLSNLSCRKSKLHSKPKSRATSSTRCRGNGTARTTKMASSRSYGSGQKKINTHQRGRKGSFKNKDLISSLPDDIVIHILSLLDQKEAVRASILSKRWRHMWALLADFYNFDALKMLWWRLKSYDDQQYDTELRKYVRYVTQIVSSSPAQNINIFRVRIPLDRNYHDDLQTWVNFAMARSVNELELNLLCPEGFICEGFSSQLTKLTLTSVFKCQSISHSPIEFPSFRKLKQLELGIRNDSYMSLPFLSNFIDACPVLNKFKLQCQMRLDIGGTQFVNRRLEATVNRADAVSSKPHHHLNTFEMVGFLGCEADTELVLYIAQFALLLEKVILHPLLEEDDFGRTKEASTREQAKLLRNQLPARIRLEIL